MEKIVYVVQTDPGEDPRPRARAILNAARTEWPALCAGLTVNVREELFESDTLVGNFKASTYCAAVSLWIDSLDNRGRFERALSSVSTNYNGYLVTESMPLDYARIDWGLGERSPGVTLVATLIKAPHLDTETFFQRWHEAHTPFSLRAHPLTRYTRNTVARRLSPGAPELWGIVEERVGCLADLEPERFYSGPGSHQHAEESLATFVDVAHGGIQTALMSEYLISRRSH